MRKLLAGVMMLCAANAAGPGTWSAPTEVRSDDNLCLTYRARLDGSYLVISAKIEPGWHTFAMDNKARAEEKLAGKKALSVDQPTEFTLTGLEVAGPWFQTAPKDFPSRSCAGSVGASTRTPFSRPRSSVRARAL